MKKNLSYKERLKKGSGILAVILSSIAIYIYVTSNYSDVEHFTGMQKKYQNGIKEIYRADFENMNEIYQKICEYYND